MTSQRFRIRLDRDQATPMTCEEALCVQNLEGWVTVVDPSTELGARQSRYIREKSGRRFFEFRAGDAVDWLAANAEREGLNGAAVLATLAGVSYAESRVFIFPPGQQCFRSHLDREVEFSQRKAAGVVRLFERPRDFNEAFNEESYRASRARERG